MVEGSQVQKRFGLVAVDRDTQARRPKPSLRYLGAIARANALDEAVTARYLAG